MSAPSPSTFQRELDRTIEYLEKVRDEFIDVYGLAYHLRFAPTGREKVSSGPTVADDGSVPGTTPSVAVGKYQLGQACHEAAQFVTGIENEARSKIGRLRGLLDAQDPREGFTPVLYPRTATRADIDDSRRAKARRHEAGERWGETPLPRAKV